MASQTLVFYSGSERKLLGPEMLQNGPLETSCAHFPAWCQKCFKTVLWRPPGLTFRAGARNASKRSPGDFLCTLSGLGPELLQNIFWRLPGLTFRAGFRAGARNALKLSSGGFLGSLSGLEAWPHKPLYFTVVLQAWPHKPLSFTVVLKAWPQGLASQTLVFYSGS